MRESSRQQQPAASTKQSAPSGLVHSRKVIGGCQVAGDQSHVGHDRPRVGEHLRVEALQHHGFAPVRHHQPGVVDVALSQGSEAADSLAGQEEIEGNTGVHGRIRVEVCAAGTRRRGPSIPGRYVPVMGKRCGSSQAGSATIRLIRATTSAAAVSTSGDISWVNSLIALTSMRMIRRSVGISSGKQT